MKKLDKPVDLDSSYDDVCLDFIIHFFNLFTVVFQTVPLIEHLTEFKALDDDGRRAAFAKFIRRQKVNMRVSLFIII